MIGLDENIPFGPRDDEATGEFIHVGIN